MQCGISKIFQTTGQYRYADRLERMIFQTVICYIAFKIFGSWSLPVHLRSGNVDIHANNKKGAVFAHAQNVFANIDKWVPTLTTLYLIVEHHFTVDKNNKNTRNSRQNNG